MASLTRAVPVAVRRALLASRALFRRGDPTPAALLASGRELPIFRIDQSPVELPDQPVGWRFFGRGSTGDAIFADVVTQADERAYTSVTRGARVEQGICHLADAMRGSGAQDHEVCLLSIPGLRIEAILFRSVEGRAKDSVLPFAFLAPELHERGYALPEFLDVVKKIAAHEEELEAALSDGGSTRSKAR